MPGGHRVPPAPPEERARFFDELMADAKNRAEHDHVVQFIQGVQRACYDVDVPAQPGILPLTHVQHLCTPPARACWKASTWER